MRSAPNDRRGFIHKKLLGAATGAFGSIVRGGNPFTGAIGGFIGGGTTMNIAPAAQQPARVVPVPGLTGTIQRFLPGGKTGFQVEPVSMVHAGGSGQGKTVRVDPNTGLTIAKRRRMNVGNAKALRRSIRRVDGFVNLAKRSLKGTGWKITRAGSSTRKSPSVIVESGSGSVVSR